MMKIPLNLRLKKKVHRDIAYAQDLIMEELYNFFPRAVFHGGTAIWRCYQGNRFSEDIDVYLDNKNLNAFFNLLEQKGFKILKKRIKNNSLYSLLEFNRTQVRFEALFLRKVGILKEYETVDGNFINVYTLSPDVLIEEKIAACLKRKKIRDLYDIFFLLRYANKTPKDLDQIEKVKITDEENLPTIILSGLIPKTEEMKKYISEWVL